MHIVSVLSVAAVCSGLLLPVQAQSVDDVFPYPKVPDTLRTIESRSEFVLTHFWDGIDFSDTTLVHRPDITEQGFVNFVDLLPRVDSLTAVKGIRSFEGRVYDARTPERVREYFTEKTDHYLADPQSPMRNDILYAMFLDVRASMPGVEAVEKERLQYLIKNVRKNRAGEIAADFRYVDRQGKESWLHSTDSEYTVVYFYDPDCDNCHRITEQLAKDTMMTADRRVRVLAIYPDTYTDEWRKKPQPFPSSWTDGYSPNGEITVKQLYYITATPTIYLLDRDKRVMLKDPSPELLLLVLKQIGEGKI